MVRSVKIAAVFVGLAWTGLAGAQSSSSPQAAAAERYITVREEGKPPQRCKLLKSWRESNGVPAFQVQAVDTGELMTIVGSGPPARGGDPRAMPTRIFHWGSANKPPAGSPPPPTTSAMIPQRTTPAVPTPQLAASAMVPQRTTPIVPMPQPAPPVLAAQKPAATLPSPVSAPPPVGRTVTPPIVSTAKPATPVITPQARSAVQGNPVSLTPMGTQIIQPRSDRQDAGPIVANSQPRLVPSADGTGAGPAPCGAYCPSSCNACGKSCNPCCQQSCVCCTPPPMKQSFFSRLFKSNRPCACPATVCQPAPAAAPPPNPAAAAALVAKAATEPATPRDWRESWGKVEPWNGAAQANNGMSGDTLTAHAAPPPVPLTSPQQPDPLKEPDFYRGMAMSARPANSKIPPESEFASAPRTRSRFFAAKRPPAATPAHPAEGSATANENPAVPPPTQSGGRVIQLPANEANAFWTPPQPPPPGPAQERPKYNAFDRDSNSPPPQGVPPAMAGVPRVPMPPRGPMPMVAPPIPQMPPMVNTGVSDALGNAFTLAGTRRPIPADFGGTPQEPNGFGDTVPQMQGQGSPPRGYMGMPAMGPRMPMGVNPLMSAPPTPVASLDGSGVSPDARPAGVPQLLTTLKDSLYPSQREEAAEQLSELNWRMQPQVVESLMTSARNDPAATVRAACVHALAHMQVNTMEAAALVRNLKSDRDPRVRQEAEEALSTLGDTGIQPASHR